jgi:kinesin family protein 5
MSSEQSAVRVFARFRPPRANHEDVGPELLISESDASVRLGKKASLRTGGAGGGTFRFDGVFPRDINQEKLFGDVGKNLIQDTLEGYNSSIIAYGQTGSGKTHTMFGPGWDENGEPRMKEASSDTNTLESHSGLVPRIAVNLFQGIALKIAKNSKVDVDVQISVIEIYNEQIRDLLFEPEFPDTEATEETKTDDKRKNQKLKIRESKRRGVYLDGVTKRRIGSASEVLQAIRYGGASRAVASTAMNDRSSRSHVVVSIHVLQRVDESDGLCSTTRSQLNLVDLAGSERVGKTHASGQTLKEAQSINQSLSALGNCMRALTQPISKRKNRDGSLKQNHIPYRDSKLTHLLKSSLGGNAKTTLIIAVASDMENLEETISTFRFGVRAKRIQNKARANKSMTLQELHLKLQILTQEVSSLKKENKALKKEMGERPQEGSDASDVLAILRNEVREKDSAFSAQKIAAESTGHKLKEANEKLAVLEASWKDMQTYSAQLLEQLNDADEQQVKLEEALAHSSSKNDEGAASEEARRAEEEELKAIAATVARDTEELEAWRTELFAWKAQTKKEFDDIEETIAEKDKEHALAMEKLELWKVKLTSETEDLETKKALMSTEWEEITSLKDEINEERESTAKMKEELDLDRNNLDQYRVSLTKDYEEFEAHKAQLMETFQTREKEINEIELQVKMKQTELTEELKIKAANKDWHAEMMEWRERIVHEYEENTKSVEESRQKLASAEKQFNLEKEDLEMREKDLGVALKSLATEQNEARSAEIKLKELEETLKQKESSLLRREDEQKKEAVAFEKIIREQNTTLKEREETCSEKESNFKKTFDEFQKNRMEFIKERENLNEEKTKFMEEKRASRVGKGEDLGVIIDDENRRAKSMPNVEGFNDLTQSQPSKPSAALPTTNSLGEVESKSPKQMTRMQRLRRLSFLRKQQQVKTSDVKAVDNNSEAKMLAQSPPKKGKAPTSQSGSAESPSSSKNKGEQISPPSKLSNIQRLRRLSQLRAMKQNNGASKPSPEGGTQTHGKNLRQKEVGETVSTDDSADVKEAEKVIQASSAALKVREEKTNASNEEDGKSNLLSQRKAEHERDRLRLEIDNCTRLIDHLKKQGDEDKNRINDLEQQLISLYASIELHQKEEREYHERIARAAKVAQNKMEEDDRAFARRLSQQINSGGLVQDLAMSPEEERRPSATAQTFERFEIDQSYIPTPERRRHSSRVEQLDDDSNSDSDTDSESQNSRTPIAVTPPPRRTSFFSGLFGRRGGSNNTGENSQ